jgi:5-methylcytosine-specific restriction endonuclease McrA
MAEPTGLAGLGYLNQAQQQRRATEKGPTRLEAKMAAKPLTVVDEKAFRASVWRRDRNRCRSCGRKVLKTLALVPERGEVHHIHSRVGDLRHDARAAILVCKQCHERITGRVNRHRLVIEPTQTFLIQQGRFINADFPVTFKELQ